MPPYATFSTPDPIHQSNKVYSPATGSIYPHMLLLICLPVAFASPPFHGRVFVFSSILLALIISTQVDPHFTNDPGVAQPFSQLWAVWVAALEKLFTARRGSKDGTKAIVGPESLFWRKNRGTREAEMLAGFGPAKWYWALGLLFNLRGANWNFQVKNVPELAPIERKSRMHFLASRGIKTMYNFVMADVVNNLWLHLYYVARDGSAFTDIGAIDSKYLTIKDSEWTWRLAKTLIWGPLPYYLISFQYNLLSLIAVATRLSDPEDWPPLFGSISKVHSVRNFWGQFWHQMMRRSFSTFTDYIVDTLRIPRGTVWSSKSQIWLAFLMTSILHAQANLITPVPSNIDYYERTAGMFQFFLWQAFAITVEDAVQGFWGRYCKRVGIDRQSRTMTLFEVNIGRLWVCTSMWVSMPWAADLTLRFRFGDELMVPFSVVGPWVERAMGYARKMG